MTTSTDILTVSAAGLPDDNQRVLALIGNDEIKLCVDRRGVMHDWNHIWPSHPPPRITWTGRRHDRRLDEYNSNFFEWGFLDLRLEGEENLPPVDHWRQTLHPRQGHVRTMIRRGAVEEETTSFVHLERNLVVFHRRYTNLPADARRLRAVHTLCQCDVAALPFRVGWTPQAADDNGIEVDTVADGLQLYHGRLALFADRPCSAAVRENRLELDIDLDDTLEVTVFLSFADDLKPLEPAPRIDCDTWMSEPVRRVFRDVNACRAKAIRPDPVAATVANRNYTVEKGYEGLFADHRTAWKAWFAGARVELPIEEERLRAALETQLYNIRCSYTAWSMPANPFNTSWGAPYFWDERFPTEGLMQLGIWDMPKRVAEFRRNILPYATMTSGGRGARYTPSVVESGTAITDRSHCSNYEFFPIPVFVNCIYNYCRYMNEEALWRRYYPIFREAAEFFRHYLFVEMPGNNAMVVPLVDVDEMHYPVQDGPFAVHGAARIFEIALRVGATQGEAEETLTIWRRYGALARGLSDHLEELRRRKAEYPDGAPANDPSGCYCDYELFCTTLPERTVDPSVQGWRDDQRRRLAPPHLFDEGKTGMYGNPENLPFWSWGELNQAYRAATNGNADSALSRLKKALTTMMDFAVLNESAKTDLTDVHHPWFTTGAGAFVRALTRMLLYPREEHVFILPGVPAGWGDLSFILPVHGGAEAEVALRDDCITKLRLNRTHGEPEPRILHIPKRFALAKDCLPLGTEMTEEEGGYRIECFIS